MNSTQGAFFNYQHFRDNLKQGSVQPSVWSNAQMGQMRDQLMGSEVDIVALASDESLNGCDLIPGMMLSMQWLEPGHTLEGHSHSWLHLFIIQAGQGELVIGDRDPLPISPGDVLMIPAWTHHGFINTSQTLPLAMLNLSNMPQISALSNYFNVSPIQPQPR